MKYLIIALTLISLTSFAESENSLKKEYDEKILKADGRQNLLASVSEGNKPKYQIEIEKLERKHSAFINISDEYCKKNYKEACLTENKKEELKALMTAETKEIFGREVAMQKSLCNATKSKKKCQQWQDLAHKYIDKYEDTQFESCNWDNSIKRKVVQGPGCNNSSPVEKCVGKVSCKVKDLPGEYKAMATCPVEKCGEDGALTCMEETASASTRCNLF